MSCEAKAKRLCRPLRVLLVEDSVPDALQVVRALELGGFTPAYERITTRAEMANALAAKTWDVILAEHTLPEFGALQALAMVKQAELEIPLFLVSNPLEEEVALAALRAGVRDYVMKERLDRLVVAVDRELRLGQAGGDRNQSECESITDPGLVNFELSKVIQERKQLECELLEIAENERRRIAFDLHDELGQMLTGITLMVKGLEQKLSSQHHPCAADARKVQQLAEQITEHAHNLAHQFSSLDVRGDDLPGVLGDLAENVGKIFDVSCRFALHGKSPNLPGNTIVQLFKIAQEAVHNAVKHGKATWIKLDLKCDGESLVLTITNDGLPFAEPRDPRNRMGLRIMNYRARTVDAQFNIKATGEHGTVVTCSLSLKQSVKAAPRNSEVVQTVS